VGPASCERAIRRTDKETAERGWDEGTERSTHTAERRSLCGLRRCRSIHRDPTNSNAGRTLLLYDNDDRLSNCRVSHEIGNVIVSLARMYKHLPRLVRALLRKAVVSSDASVTLTFDLEGEDCAQWRTAKVIRFTPFRTVSGKRQPTKSDTAFVAKPNHAALLCLAPPRFALMLACLDTKINKQTLPHPSNTKRREILYAAAEADPSLPCPLLIPRL
jgi:hypothetical protein